MSPNVIAPGKQRTTRRVVRRALFAAALFVFAVAIAPIWVLMVACSMPCCEGESFPFVQPALGAACAEHCGISSSATSYQFPDAVAASTETPQTALAALATAETTHDTAPTPHPRHTAFSVESHHAVPGDAPLYIYNSAFLL